MLFFEQCEDGMCKMFKSKCLERVQILRYIICSVALIKFINLCALVYPSVKWDNNNCLIGFKIRGYRIIIDYQLPQWFFFLTTVFIFLFHACTFDISFHLNTCFCLLWAYVCPLRCKICCVSRVMLQCCCLIWQYSDP